jgi:RNA methyltransferase, TrmH family
MDKISLQQLKWVKSLQHPKVRAEERKFVVEGEKIVLEAIKEKSDFVEMVIATSEWYHHNPISERAYVASSKEMERMTALNSASQVMVVMRFLPLMALKKSPVLLVLDGVRDPGNLGTIIRTADWFGVQQIVCSEDTVDFYNQKALQSTMGSFLRVEVHYENLELFLREQQLPILGTMLDPNAMSIQKIRPENAVILLLGNESKGVRRELLPHISHPVFINGAGNAESLNVAVAAGICLHHLCESCR